MAVIRPFKAYRPCKGMEQIIAALPYDVYNRAEAKAVVTRNPDSFLAIDRAETGLDDSVDTYAPQVYERAASLLKSRIAQGQFICDDTPCYYLYELIMDGRSQTGIVACASIDDYCNNVIKKHENTRADKEEDRIRHVDICNMQTGPIFLAYRSTEALKNIVKETKNNLDPVYSFVSDDGIGHNVWMISDREKVESIKHSFEEISSVYIADGHHRCASAVKVGLKRREENPGFTGKEEFNYFLSVLFPDDELKILDYNRVVKDLNGYNVEQFLELVSEKFTVEKAEGQVHPGRKGEFGMYLEDCWYRLTAKESILSPDAVEGLDVSILQHYLLEPILGIGDPRTDKRIDFVGGIRGLDELEKRVHSDMEVAFSMYPTAISELFAVADSNRLMPPKSTWFEPKLRSGLFLHSLS